MPRPENSQVNQGDLFISSESNSNGTTLLPLDPDTRTSKIESAQCEKVHDHHKMMRTSDAYLASSA